MARHSQRLRARTRTLGDHTAHSRSTSKNGGDDLVSSLKLRTDLGDLMRPALRFA
jgi:hypothetical protein